LPQAASSLNGKASPTHALSEMKPAHYVGREEIEEIKDIGRVF